MLHFKKSYFAPDTFLDEDETSSDLEFIEMNSKSPIFAASVRMASGEILWRLLSGPGALARAHEGRANRYKALAVFQLEPDFKDGIGLCLVPVSEWVAGVKVVTDRNKPHEAYRISGEVLIPDAQ